jgi:tetratricopeptide (TPR) repeat protein
MIFSKSGDQENTSLLITIFSLFCLMGTNIALSEKLEDSIEKAANLYNEAIDLYSQDKIEQSIDYFIKALELKPDFYEAHYNLAQILMSLNKNDEAIKSLEEIAKIKPDDPENLYNLGKTYYKKGYLSKSYECLKAITVNSPQYDSAKLLIDKIENRQNELNLEEKMNARQNSIDEQGKALAIALGEFSAPSGVVVDSRGNVFVASFLENRIYKITTFGKKEILPRTNLIQGPIGLAIDKDDNIFVANYSANNIIKLTPEGAPSIYADVKKPYCLIYDKAHNRLYVTEQDTNKLLKFDL